MLYNITLTYKWWRNAKDLPKLPDSYIIKNEYLKSKIKNHCKSEEFSKILKKYGSNTIKNKSNNGEEAKDAYDYMFRMWTIWILIILKYEKGSLFLDSEQLTETDFVNMITDTDKLREVTSWDSMFTDNNDNNGNNNNTKAAAAKERGKNVYIKKELNDNLEFELTLMG